MLRIAGVSHHFGERQVLSGLNVELGDGRILVILGPNGAGKTTLLRLLCGILPLQQGSIDLNGHAVPDSSQHSAWRGQVGLLTEAPGLYEVLSVRENLSVFGRLQDLSVTLTRERIAELSQRFGFADRLDQRCGSLSKGLKQRVALARAVLHRPQLLLLDEPTSGLDPAAAEQLRSWLLQLRAEGCTVVLTTHDLDEAAGLADELRVLNQRMVKLPEQLAGWCLQVEQAEHWSAWLREQGWQAQVGAGDRIQLQGPGDIPQLLAALCAAGARVHGLTEQSSALLPRYRLALQQLAGAR